jgi:hypothetical protein
MAGSQHLVREEPMERMNGGGDMDTVIPSPYEEGVKTPSPPGTGGEGRGGSRKSGASKSRGGSRSGKTKSSRSRTKGKTKASGKRTKAASRSRTKKGKAKKGSKGRRR